MDNYEVLEHKVMTELVNKFPMPIMMGAKYFPTPPSALILGQTAEWDTLQKGRNMANYVPKDGEANIARRMVIKNNSFTVAFKKEKKMIEGSTMALLRAPGTKSQQYGAQAVVDELEDLFRMIQNRNEWENWQALGGTLTVSQDNGVKFTISYSIDATHTPTVTKSWADTNADIISNVKTWKRLIEQDSGEVAVECVVKDEVMEAMIKNIGIQKFMGDALKTQVGATGRITRFMDLDWSVYNAGYVPIGGSFTPFLGTTKMFMATAPTFGKRIIGASLDPKSGFKPGRFSKSWTEEDPANTFVLVEENSLPCLQKVENIVMATVII